MSVSSIISSVASSGSNVKTKAVPAAEPVSSMFEGMLKDVVNNVNQTELDAKMETLKIASGQSDNLHSLTISSAKAELALSALVQMRNKALDAYNEIMRITL